MLISGNGYYKLLAFTLKSVPIQTVKYMITLDGFEYYPHLMCFFFN